MSISAGKVETDTTETLEGTATPAWTWKLMELTLTRGALLARSTDCCSVVCCCAVRLVRVWV